MGIERGAEYQKDVPKIIIGTLSSTLSAEKLVLLFDMNFRVNFL